MIKNVAWDTKEKKISAIIFALIFSSLLFFETMRANFIETSYLYILYAAAAGILFSLFFVTNIEGKWNRVFSAQGILSVATVIVTLGMTLSHRMGTTSKEGFFSLLFTSAVVLLAQNFYLLPVTAVIGAVMSSMASKPEIQSLTLSCIPAAIGISCICLSPKLKDSAIWKKIVFVLVQPVLFASFAYTIYCHRFVITFHSLMTEMWDSAASAIAVVVLFALAVFALIKKKSAGEIFGYLAVALMGVVPMLMEMKYVFLSAMGMYMVLHAASKEGSVADEVFNDTVKFLDPRNKKKSKSKAKKKKI